MQADCQDILSTSFYSQTLFQQLAASLIFTNLIFMKSTDLTYTCIKPVKFTTLAFLAVFSKKINQPEWCTHIQPPPSQFHLNWLVSPAILHSTLIVSYVFFPLISTSASLWFVFVTTTP